MNLEKLEKLSCLKIEQSQRDYILESLHGVIELLHEVESLPLPEVKNKSYENMQFRQGSVIIPTKLSLHLEDGLFLAPKVIKKD